MLKNTSFTGNDEQLSVIFETGYSHVACLKNDRNLLIVTCEKNGKVVIVTELL